jgi:hydrogenase nickel incorporation protein HypB
MTAARMIACALTVNPDLTVLPLSAYSGEGLPSWYGWLRGRLGEARAAA